MFRQLKCRTLLAAAGLVACGAEDAKTTNAVTPERAETQVSLQDGGAPDGRRMGDAAVECLSGVACVDGGYVPWQNICVYSVTEVPSAGLYQVCVVDDHGNAGLVMIRGDRAIANRGWTHSAYGNGLFASTLTDAGMQQCSEITARLSDPLHCVPKNER